jgi:hypothetical protein
MFKSKNHQAARKMTMKLFLGSKKINQKRGFRIDPFGWNNWVKFVLDSTASLFSWLALVYGNYNSLGLFTELRETPSIAHVYTPLGLQSSPRMSKKLKD